MTQVSEDIYDSIAKSKATGGSEYIVDGSYLFQIGKLTIEKTFKGIMFIAEQTVRRADPVNVTLLDATKNEQAGMSKPNPVGSKPSYIVNLSKGESAFGNVKAYILALDGTPESEVTPDDFKVMLKNMTSAANPMRGAFVLDTTYRKTIQKGPNAGKPFMAHKWAHYGGQTAESIALERAKLDAEDKQAEARA